jgi:hypothetical protein
MYRVPISSKGHSSRERTSQIIIDVAGGKNETGRRKCVGVASVSKEDKKRGTASRYRGGLPFRGVFV